MYLSIERTRQGYRIKHDDGEPMHYIGYAKRDAIRRYRREYGLVGKRLHMNEW